MEQVWSGRKILLLWNTTYFILFVGLFRIVVVLQSSSIFPPLICQSVTRQGWSVGSKRRTWLSQISAAASKDNLSGFLFPIPIFYNQEWLRDDELLLYSDQRTSDTSTSAVNVLFRHSYHHPGQSKCEAHCVWQGTPLHWMTCDCLRWQLSSYLPLVEPSASSVECPSSRFWSWFTIFYSG